MFLVHPTSDLAAKLAYPRTKTVNQTTRIVQSIVKGTSSSRAPNPSAGE